MSNFSFYSYPPETDEPPKTFTGQVNYSIPESLEYLPCSYESDMWTLAITILRLYNFKTYSGKDVDKVFFGKNCHYFEFI